MAEFLTSSDLNSAMEGIFESAEKQLLLISPYIKLHERYKSILKSKLQNHKLEIIVVFGKNEDDVSKSIKIEDINFFTDFPNIEIRYEKRLHAKYYSNEHLALITSMNLYSYSQDHNIEAGILTQTSLLDNLTGGLITKFTSADTFDGHAYSYFMRVIEQAEILFKKTPDYESALLGFQNKYVGSTVEIDNIANFFKGGINKETKSQVIETKITTTSKPSTSSPGYCIRTGKEIPFNVKQLMTKEAFESWSKFKNEDYPEKYCHFTGEKSDGETSVSRPILKKNWQKAKEFHKF